MNIYPLILVLTLLFGLPPSAFAEAPALPSEDEQFRTAVSLSHEKQYDEAITLLRRIIQENPKNHNARVHLARVLSWSGRLAEAENEIDGVLAEFPGSMDALLVKANILRFTGEAGASAALYEKVLSDHEEFDARLGLAYARIATGEAGAAETAAAGLRPLTEDQEKEFVWVNKALCAVKPFHAETDFFHYRDSDINSVDQYRLSAGMRIGTGGAGLGSRLTNAEDPFRKIRAEELWLTGQFRAGSLAANATAGLYLPEGSGKAATGSVRLTKSMAGGTAGIAGSREALADTAFLIKGGILRTTGAFSATQHPGNDLTFSETYSHSVYSDDNNADDVLVGARKGILRMGGLALDGEYRFRYVDFKRQSLGGYFDPENFVAHRVLVQLHAEHQSLYADLEPSAGVLSYTRYGEYRSMGFSGVAADLGWRMTPCASLELYARHGNYAAGTAVGFAYDQAGLAVKGSF